MDRGAWWATVHGIAKSRTGLRDRACVHAVDNKVLISEELSLLSLPAQEVGLLTGHSVSRRLGN